MPERAREGGPASPGPALDASGGVPAAGAGAGPRLPGFRALVESLGPTVFNNPAFDSSGDIYHLMGALALAQAAGAPPPDVSLAQRPDGADPKGTRVHAQRGKGFANAIGVAADMAQNDFISKMRDDIEHMHSSSGGDKAQQTAENSR